LPPKARRNSRRRKSEHRRSLGRRVGVIGRTQANVTLLRVILKESGVDPARSRSQFGTTQILDMAPRSGIDRSWRSVRWTARSQPMPSPRTATAKASRIPSHRRLGSHRAEHPLYESEEMPAALLRVPARPEDKVETVSVDTWMCGSVSLLVGFRCPAFLRCGANSSDQWRRVSGALHEPYDDAG